MVSRLLANPSIQRRDKLPGGERFGNTRPSNAPDKQVTNGVVEANQGAPQLALPDPKPIRLFVGEGA
jgi:hypothetical protein